MMGMHSAGEISKDRLQPETTKTENEPKEPYPS